MTELKNHNERQSKMAAGIFLGAALAACATAAAVVIYRPDFSNREADYPRTNSWSCIARCSLADMFPYPR